MSFFRLAQCFFRLRGDNAGQAISFLSAGALIYRLRDDNAGHAMFFGAARRSLSSEPEVLIRNTKIQNP
jgi:hypothetical protein